MSAKSSKRVVNPDDIALMQYESGWWLKVGGDWYCILNAVGVVFNKEIPTSQDGVATRAPFYDTLSNILSKVSVNEKT